MATAEKAGAGRLWRRAALSVVVFVVVSIVDAVLHVVWLSL